MFEGYDPDRRPPYAHEEIRKIGDKIYKVTWLVSNGYGGSISISSSMKLIDPEELEDIKQE